MGIVSGNRESVCDFFLSFKIMTICIFELFLNECESSKRAGTILSYYDLGRPFGTECHCTMKLRIATYNIHKGFSFNLRMMVHALRYRLQGIDADIVFLQEVQGENPHQALRLPDWPTTPL